MKTNGLDRTKRLSRLPIQVAAKIPTIDYVFLDYQLFRNGLDGYQIHISTMVDELNLSKPTVIALCKKYLGLGILNQDNGKYQHQKCYHLNYNTCESYIYNLIDDNGLVKPVDQPGKASLPGLVKPVDQTLVKPVDHTSIRKEIISNIQVGEISNDSTLSSPETKEPVAVTESNVNVSVLHKQLLEAKAITKAKESPEAKAKEELDFQEVYAKLFEKHKQLEIKRVNISGYVPSDAIIKLLVNKELSYYKRK